MKEPYVWDYTIRIKTKEGTFEYEESNVIDAVKTIEKHPDYEEFYMQHKKPKCDKCNIELNEVFIQQNEFRTYKLCKTCNEKYLKYQDNIKKLKKVMNNEKVGKR